MGIDADHCETVKGCEVYEIVRDMAGDQFPGHFGLNVFERELHNLKWDVVWIYVTLLVMRHFNKRDRHVQSKYSSVSHCCSGNFA